ncbi:MAG: T9SS type A sorting domain-containing protein, partial [Ginsengibacter sp.]
AGNLFYRIKETDKDGDYVYSSIALLRNQGNSESIIIFPNPANDLITISSPPNGAGKTKIELYDAIGRQLISKIITNSTDELNTASLPDGTYVLKIENNGSLSTRKILIMHH